MQELRGFMTEDGKLSALPAKRRKRLAALLYLSEVFEMGREYSEHEVNALLCKRCNFNDPATLRRELFELKILNRTPDCRSYRLRDPQPSIEELERRYL